MQYEAHINGSQNSIDRRHLRLNRKTNIRSRIIMFNFLINSISYLNEYYHTSE
jgi:hypothetical protein